MFLESYRLLLDIMAIVNIIFALTVVFNERKNPVATWAWLMVVLIIPYVGFIVYLLVGIDIRKSKTFLKKSYKDDVYYKWYLKNIKSDDVKLSEQYEYFSDLLILNLASGNTLFLDNNTLDFYNDGNDKFMNMLKDIKNAKSFIHLQYYIIRSDSLGKKILDALTQKVKEGLEVRLLIDGMGCLSTSKRLFKEFKKVGGNFEIFMPPRFFRANFQNHRKLAIIDGEIGYIGGFNIGDEYIGNIKKFGYWRDMHIRILGESVRELNIRYIMDWNFVSSKKIQMNEKYLKSNITSDVKTGIQIISSGPDTKWASIHNSYLKMISSAKKNIYIQTPYFIPDDSILQCLRVAALSGVDVRIMIPSKPDHPFVYWANISYLGDLLDYGVKCYKYKRGFLHSKLLIVDDLVSSVGTANMDIRSFNLNFEINAIIYDEASSKKLACMFNADLNDSIQLTTDMFKNRSKINKIRESIARLISPIL